MIISLCLVRPACKLSHPKSERSLVMLRSLVAPVIILAASLWTASNCFLLSVEALSQTASLYSRSGLIKDIYIFFSRAFLFILN